MPSKWQVFVGPSQAPDLGHATGPAKGPVFQLFPLRQAAIPFRQEMTDSASPAAAIHPAQRPQLPLLTTLRFFAALQVLVMHLVPNPLRSSLSYAPLIGAGDEAVIFFFVLSGFILNYVYSGKREDTAFAIPASRFWRARLARLWPAMRLD